MKFNYWASGFCAGAALHHIVSGNLAPAIILGLFSIANLICGEARDNNV